jgi:hypothetical protein
MLVNETRQRDATVTLASVAFDFEQVELADEFAQRD